MKYIISKEAEKDLENIWLYTFQTWFIHKADEYLNLIIAKFQFIANHPNSGKEYSQIREGYFRSKIKAHYIFYKVEGRNKVVQIIRILPKRMDIETRLREYR